MPYLANKYIGGLVEFEFHINKKYFFSIWNILNTNFFFTVYLKFKCNWASSVLLRHPRKEKWKDRYSPFPHRPYKVTLSFSNEFELFQRFIA